MLLTYGKRPSPKKLAIPIVDDTTNGSSNPSQVQSPYLQSLYYMQLHPDNISTLNPTIQNSILAALRQEQLKANPNIKQNPIINGLNANSTSDQIRQLSTYLLNEVNNGNKNINVNTPLSDASGKNIGDYFFNQQEPITQAYGNVNPAVEKFSRRGINYGTDIGAQSGQAINLPTGQYKVIDVYDQATKPGFIGDSTNNGYGNSVLVQNKDTGEKLRFSHLSQVHVNKGSDINGGVIGNVGQTGNASGPHLDLEYYDQNGHINDIMKSPYKSMLFANNNTQPAPKSSNVLGALTSSIKPKTTYSPPPIIPKIQMPKPVIQPQPRPVPSPNFSSSLSIGTPSNIINSGLSSFKR